MGFCGVLNWQGSTRIFYTAGLPKALCLSAWKAKLLELVRKRFFNESVNYLFMHFFLRAPRKIRNYRNPLKDLVQLAFKLKANKGNRSGSLNHIFCKGDKILIDGMTGWTWPVMFHSQKEKKKTMKQVDIIGG